ncbi:MAG: BamA/TamA family outer membrane protein [Acetobacteraceae bacterium]|nr:BamA/TamA family outer membrane protein [Acetobacteraceae bacterium]
MTVASASLFGWATPSTRNSAKCGRTPSCSARSPTSARLASIFIRDQEGKTLLSQVSQVLTYDRRNSRIDPTEGFVIRLLTDISGLGGNVGFFRPRLDGAYYLPVSPGARLA